MERFGKEVGVSLAVGLAVAAIWAVLGIVTTHSAWSWPEFFGRSAEIAVPVATWKIIGIAKIIFILAILVGVAIFIGILALMIGALVAL